MLSDFTALFQTDFYITTWRIIFATWPIWLPVLTFWLFMSTWLNYKRRDWLNERGYVLLEIKIPKDIQRTPAAMELVLEGIWEDVAGTWTSSFLEGELRDVFSLEMVSLGGEVKFFIWAFPKWKHVIESRVYAQYPGAEVVEAEDYALKVRFDPDTMDLTGVTTKLANSNDGFPIKTYVEFEFDKAAGKEQEEIVDPLSPIIEYLGSLKPGEQLWIQIVIQGHRKEGLQDGRIIPKPDLKPKIEAAIKEVIEKRSAVKPEKDKPHSLLNLTEEQKNAIKAIERNGAKLAFDSMFRFLYVAPKDISVKRNVGIIGAMRQFGSKTLNGIRPDQFIPGISYQWEDYLDINRIDRQKTLLEAYKRRSIFNVPFRHVLGTPYVLSTEELATLYHFPGATVTTPSLSRVPSKRAEAPSNLPV